jgi:hypothetical protein
MKRRNVFLLLLMALFVVYLAGCTGVFFFPDRDKGAGNAVVLTKTRWKQMGGFEQYTPDSLRVGCWSTALAQLMYYHRLKPFGHVAYTSRNGYKIDEFLDSSKIDFSLFADTIDSSTPGNVKDQLARYSYYAALAVQKDFGTDRYMHKLAPAGLLEQHYQVAVSRYISWHKLLPYTSGKLEQVICGEIDHERPVFLHFANLKDFGHSVVLDGYRYDDGSFMVHINQGQGGPADGWYDFHKGILRKDDDALRVIYTFSKR